MICDSVILKGSVEIGDQTIVHPSCIIISEKGTSITIGEGNIIEERSRLLNTNVGMASLIEVGVHISNSVIGSYCQIGPKCQISNCVIGNCCVIAPMIHLKDITIPDNTAVYPFENGWKMAPCQIDTIYPAINEYRRAISSPDYHTFIGRHHTLLGS